MKYVILSLIFGFLFIFFVLAITFFQGGNEARYSYVGIWRTENENLEISFSDTHLTIDGKLMEYKVIQKDDWLFFVTENSSGQVPENELTLLFKVQGRNQLELLSFGVKPLDGSILKRK